MTKVVELGTNKEFYFSLPPKEAVNACYEQQFKKNYNTWEYEKTIDKVKQTKSGQHFYRGNFATKAF